MRLRVVTTVLGTVLGLLALTTGPATAATERADLSGSQQQAIRGGDRLYSIGGSCTVGFNATNGTAYFATMPGHCGDVGTQWYADPQLTVPVGVTDTSVFPGGDHALIAYTSGLTHPSEITAGGQSIAIDRAADPVVGQQVCQASPATGIRCGTVTAVNVTISFPEGTVSGLFESDICAEPGDTGAPAFDERIALGFAIGSTGTCTSGGSTYYQPLIPLLDQYGLSVGY